MGQSNTKESTLERDHSFNLTRTSTNESYSTSKPKKHLTKVELVSIRSIFNDIKSTFPDHVDCIDPKHFLDHLKLPKEVEPAGVLLYKSFLYLGSYPLCTTAEPVPLSFDAFITAFVVLIGRLDIKGNPISENMLFQSLSILPPPKEENLAKIVPEEAHEETTARESKGLSLAELGIDFNDMDINKQDENSEDEGEAILARDLIELFVFLLWLGQVDKPVESDFKELRATATHLVDSIKPTRKDDDLQCITHSEFKHWKAALAPHLFKPLQSFINKSFTYYNTDGLPSRLLPEDAVPEIDYTDILTPLNTTLLHWSLSVQTTKRWTRLYSAEENGFSMNRFESHVFKYPGPTLFIMRVDTPEGSKVLGAYIARPWKLSKQFWGNSDCFLFELDPTFDIYLSQSKNDHYMYYHHDVGIGFGALDHQQHPKFIISLDNSLQGGTYQHEAYIPQPSFESGSRAAVDFHIKFDIENIEVVGLGTDKDRETQAKEWEFDKKEASRRAGLNIRKADGEIDKELLKMAGIIDEDKRQDR